MTEATSNAKQVFYLLIEFDQDFGEFPSDSTAIFYPGKNGESDLDLRACKGAYSNDYLGQLIAGGYIKSEEIFYVHDGHTKKPDNVISPKEKILEAGESGYAYYKNASTSDNSGRPILMAPMSKSGLTFDSKPFDGKAVVLRIDGAVKQVLLDKNTNEAKIGDGKTLFGTGPGTAWGNGEFDPANIVPPRR